MPYDPNVKLEGETVRFNTAVEWSCVGQGVEARASMIIADARILLRELDRAICTHDSEHKGSTLGDAARQDEGIPINEWWAAQMAKDVGAIDVKE